MAVQVFKVKFWEDGSATCLGRLVAEDATGEATGYAGEGRWIKQADLSTITCAVFDLDSTTPRTAIATPTVTISDVIEDTPVTNGEIWDVDDIGYNFHHNLAATNFPTGNHQTRIEYLVTSSGGTKSWGVWEGPVQEVFTS